MVRHAYRELKQLHCFHELSADIHSKLIYIHDTAITFYCHYIAGNGAATVARLFDVYQRYWFLGNLQSHLRFDVFVRRHMMRYVLSEALLVGTHQQQSAVATINSVLWSRFADIV